MQTPTTPRDPNGTQRKTLILLVALILLLSACRSPRPAAPPNPSPTSIPPTQLPVQSTPTQSPSPTLLPPTQTPAPTQAADYEYGQPAQPTATLTELPTTTPTATATAETAISKGVAAPLNVTVTVEDDYFSPRKITVPVGSTVTWIEVGGEPHTVNADNGSFKSGVIPKGKTFSHTFTKAGTFRYYCKYHGWLAGIGMAGVIIVTP